MALGVDLGRASKGSYSFASPQAGYSRGRTEGGLGVAWHAETNASAYSLQLPQLLEQPVMLQISLKDRPSCASARTVSSFRALQTHTYMIPL
jgi:hypothetical protein